MSSSKAAVSPEKPESWASANIEGEYLGCFENEKEAAEVVAKKPGQPKASLLRPASKAPKGSRAPAASKYKHVVFHKGCKPWRAEIMSEFGKKFLGCFQDEEEAAEAVAKKLGQLKASLLRATVFLPGASMSLRSKSVAASLGRSTSRTNI